MSKLNALELVALRFSHSMERMEDLAHSMSEVLSKTQDVSHSLLLLFEAMIKLGEEMGYNSKEE